MTETPTAVENHPCDACGTLDSDPMIHIQGPWQRDERITVNDPSFHFDCLPLVYRELLTGPSHVVTVATIEAAESGIHGEDLRKFIAEQPTDNTTEEA